MLMPASPQRPAAARPLRSRREHAGHASIARLSSNAPRTVLARRARREMLIKTSWLRRNEPEQPIGHALQTSGGAIPESQAQERACAHQRRRAGTLSGGVRRLLLSRGETLPVGSARTDPGQHPLASEQLVGNRLCRCSSISRSPRAIPYALQLVLARLSIASTDAGAGAKTLIDITSLAPPALHAVLARSLFDVRLFNLTITNVPASPKSLYAFGARLREVLPLVPICWKASRMRSTPSLRRRDGVRNQCRPRYGSGPGRARRWHPRSGGSFTMNYVTFVVTAVRHS